MLFSLLAIPFQFDGLDATFTQSQKPVTLPKQPVKIEAEKPSVTDGTAHEAMEEKHENETHQVIFPVKKEAFSQIGKKSQLQIAIAITNQAPDPHDFDNFPLPSSKEIKAAKLKAEADARALEEQKFKEAAALEEARKPKVKSTTKVEQVSTLTNEVVHIWASAEDAASTMVSSRLFMIDR
jgi:hypothetical protein